MRRTRSQSEVEQQARARAELLVHYRQLKQYAISFGVDATPVKIRLEDARKAAEDSEGPKFDKLAKGIWTTLEEHYRKIQTSRQDVISTMPV